jgi:hypothetical protein
MKIRGREIKGPNEQLLVIPRPNIEVPEIVDGKPTGKTISESGDIVFKVRAVLDYSDFEKMCPTPQPPMVRKLGQAQATPDISDVKYTEMLGRWASQRTHYMMLKSLEATEGLEWETVKINEPDTWEGFAKELEAAGLTNPEAAKLLGAISQVNGIDEDKYEEARQRFLHSQVARV